jgi:hypothetical protein
MGVLMSFILSPNMNLPVPVVGQEPGPNYATDVNNSLTLIDQHTHLPGSGVLITTAAININASLPMNNFNLTGLGALTLVAQSSFTTANSIYEDSSGNLHYINGAGLDIQVTNSSGVNVTPTSIPGLVPPASLNYVPISDTFVFQSNVNIAANLDAGSVLLRNLSPNSTFSLTLSPPGALSNNYTITLPTIPVSQSFVTLDTSGNLSGATPFSAGITSSNIAAATILGSNIAASTITASNISTVNSTSVIFNTGFRVSSSSIVPILHDTYTALTWNGTYYNLGGTSPSGGSSYIAPKTGYYRVSACAELQVGNTGQQAFIYAGINGSLYSTMGFGTIVDNGQPNTITGATSLHANAGDVLQIYLFFTLDPNTRSTTGLTLSNWWTLEYLGQ